MAGRSDDPQQKVKKRQWNTSLKETGQEQQTEIELPLYHYMELVYFEENADNNTVEKTCRKPFWVEENHTGTIPNEVPRRDKGYVFVGWSKRSAATTADCLPGDDIEVGTVQHPLVCDLDFKINPRR